MDRFRLGVDADNRDARDKSSVSANGPSSTRGSPGAGNVIRAPRELGIKPSPSSSTPA